MQLAEEFGANFPNDAFESTATTTTATATTATEGDGSNFAPKGTKAGSLAAEA